MEQHLSQGGQGSRWTRQLPHAAKNLHYAPMNHTRKHQNSSEKNVLIAMILKASRVSFSPAPVKQLM